jgi:hypothetical protein
MIQAGISPINWKILTDEDLRASMLRASRKLAESMSWENIAGRYAELYGRVAAGK